MLQPVRFGKWDYRLESLTQKIEAQIETRRRNGVMYQAPDPQVMHNLYQLESEPRSIERSSREGLLVAQLKQATFGTVVEVFNRIKEFHQYSGSERLAKIILKQVNALNSFENAS